MSFEKDTPRDPYTSSTTVAEYRITFSAANVWVSEATTMPVYWTLGIAVVEDRGPDFERDIGWQVGYPS